MSIPTNLFFQEFLDPNSSATEESSKKSSKINLSPEQRARKIEEAYDKRPYLKEFINKGAAYLFKKNCDETFEKYRELLLDKPSTDTEPDQVPFAILFIFMFISLVSFSYFCTSWVHAHGGFKQKFTVKGWPFGSITSHQLLKYIDILDECILFSIAVSILMYMILLYWREGAVKILAWSGVVTFFTTFFYIRFFTEEQEQASQLFFIFGISYCGLISTFSSEFAYASKILKTISDFITANGRILLISVLGVFKCVIIIFIWVCGFHSTFIMYSKDYLSYYGFLGSMLFWFAGLYFFYFYFYYSSVFITSYAFAFWIYKSNRRRGSFIVKPYWHLLRYQLGTVTFASLVIPVFSVLRVFVMFASWRELEGLSGLIGKLFYGLVCGCTKEIQSSVRVFNGHTVIVSGLTGLGFYDSSKIVGKVAFDDLKAYEYFSIFSYIIRLGSVICSGVLPTLYFCVKVKANDPDSVHLLMGSSMMILFICSVIGVTILQIFVEALNTMYLIQRIDQLLGIENAKIQQWKIKEGLQKLQKLQNEDDSEESILNISFISDKEEGKKQSQTKAQVRPIQSIFFKYALKLF